MALDTFFGSSRSPQNTDSQRRDQAIDQMDLHEKSKEIRTMLLNISNAEEKLSIIKRKLAVISHTQSEKLMQDSKMQIFQKWYVMRFNLSSQIRNMDAHEGIKSLVEHFYQNNLQSLHEYRHALHDSLHTLKPETYEQISNTLSDIRKDASRIILEINMLKNDLI